MQMNLWSKALKSSDTKADQPLQIARGEKLQDNASDRKRSL